MVFRLSSFPAIPAPQTTVTLERLSGTSEILAAAESRSSGVMESRIFLRLS